MRLKMYKDRLSNCAKSMIILNKRLKSAADPRSYGDILIENIEQNSVKFSALVNEGSFQDERERDTSNDYIPHHQKKVTPPIEVFDLQNFRHSTGAPTTIVGADTF